MASPEERKQLLELARKTIEAVSQGYPLPSVPDGEIFLEKGGVFVTLKKNGDLRGCIGHFRGIGSIGETVIGMASSAAMNDPRFMAVQPDEVGDLSISISLLSQMIETAAQDVEPGRHGVYIRSGRYSGTLLPQVASEEGWDRETLLSHTCMKAGLHPDAWRTGNLEIFTYTAEVFGEEEEIERSHQT